MKNILKNKRTDFYIILGLILLGLFFRLWHLPHFQYWSDDEQLLWSIVRHMVIDRHPSLVTPNVALGVGLGPLFHYLLIPWFWLVKFDPVKILPLGNLFFILTVILIYWAGKLISGKWAGFMAGFLYTSSFMASLFDRRLWALSPNPALILLGIISLIQIVKGKSQYLILLVVPVVFAFNSDPSLGVIILTAIFTSLIFRPKLQKKHLLSALTLALILLLPLLIFEIRHHGQNLISLRQTITEKALTTNSIPPNNGSFLLAQIGNFTRFFYAKDSQAADAYFCYCQLDNQVPTALVVITGLTLILFAYFAWKEKSKPYFILLIAIVSYLSGILIFRYVFGGNTSFFYSITISPVLFLIAAVMLTKIKFLPYMVLPILFFANLHSLTHSDFKYPLNKKIALVKEITAKLPDKNNFSLYYSGDILSAGGGWTSLFMTIGYFPVKGSLSQYWGHVYESYGLYPTSFSKNEPDTVVIIFGNSFQIYNNLKKSFNPERDLQKLYQPKYF